MIQLIYLSLKHSPRAAIQEDFWFKANVNGQGEWNMQPNG